MRPVVVLPAGSLFWYRVSDAELEAERAEDVARGDALDSAGETRLYPSVRGDRLAVDTVATVLRRRGVTWDHWRARPKNLAEGLATIEGVPRVVMFRLA